MKSKIKKLAMLSAIAASASLTLATPAFAHDELVSMTPSAGSTVTQAPQEIVMQFSGDIITVDGANQVKVVDAEGHDLTDGQPKINGKTVTQKLKTDDSANDTYTVTWRVVSSDGHPIQSSFEYSIGTGSTSAKESQAPAPNFHSHTATDNASDTGNNPISTTGFTPKNIGIFAAATVLVLGAIIAVILKNRQR